MSDWELLYLAATLDVLKPTCQTEHGVPDDVPDKTRPD